MVGSVASKRVLDPHPATAGAGIIGVVVFFVAVFVYLRIPVCDVVLKLGCLSVCPAVML